MSASIADADAVSELIYRLGQSAVASETFGDGNGAVNVSGDVEGPWPHITVGPAGSGDLRGLHGGSVETGVLLEFITSADLTIGAAELWQRAMRVLEYLCQVLPDEDTPAGRPVVCHVRPSGWPSEQPLSSGQSRVSATLSVVIAPPQD